MSCGCGKYNDDHGDQRNVTLNDLQEAARASDISLEQCCSNMVTACGEVKQHGTGGKQMAA